MEGPAGPRLYLFFSLSLSMLNHPGSAGCTLLGWPAAGWVQSLFAWPWGGFTPCTMSGKAALGQCPFPGTSPPSRLLHHLNTVPCACWFGLRRVCFTCPLLGDGYSPPQPWQRRVPSALWGKYPPGLFFNVLTPLFGVRPCSVFQPVSWTTLPINYNLSISPAC